jgi:1,4-alpha-glucan branching enzyme
MYSIDSYRPGGRTRYSAKNNTRPVHFICVAPKAECVMLIGDFNGWDPASHPMHRHPDGGWHSMVPLSHGHHRYLFLVDGEPTLDPKARGTERHAQGKVSLVWVS